MNIQVEKEDITEIGFTSYDEDGYLAVMCAMATHGIELILLRNILKCFGEEYKIVEENYIDTCATFITNLPYSIYQSIIWEGDEPDMVKSNVLEFGDWKVRCAGKGLTVHHNSLELLAWFDEDLEKITFDTEKKTVSISVKKPKTLGVPRTLDLSDDIKFFEELRKNIEKILITNEKGFTSVTPNADRTVFEVS